MAQIIGGVTNKYNQLFANEFITNLTAPDKIIRRVDNTRLEINNLASYINYVRLRSTAGYVDFGFHAGLGFIVERQSLVISHIFTATPREVMKIRDSDTGTVYQQIFVSTSELIYKTVANITTTIDCPADLILKSGTAIAANIAGSHILTITSQGIATQSQLEDITASPPNGTVLDPNKNVFLHGVVRLQTSTGASSCQVEISPDGTNYYVVWRAAILTAIGNVDTGFNIYVPAGWYVRISLTNAQITGLYKIRL